MKISQGASLRNSAMSAASRVEAVVSSLEVEVLCPGIVLDEYIWLVNGGLLD